MAQTLIEKMNQFLREASADVPLQMYKSTIEEWKNEVNSMSSVKSALLYNPSGFTNGNPITWTAVDFDSDGFASGDGSGFTIPAAMAGAYLFTLQLNWSWGGTKPSWIRGTIDFTPEPNLFSPEVSLEPGATVPPDKDSLSLSAMGKFAVDDQIKAAASWNGGSSVGVGAPAQCQFGLVYLGALV